MATALNVNGVAVYALSSGKSLPQWLSEAKKRSLKKDEAFRRRIDLIQDFAFPSACNSLAVSGDGRYIVATGTYPPRVRVFDTVDKSMKFERYMDASTVAACVLGDDYTKMAFLQDDRHIEVHAGYGKHHRTRIPLFGRDMAYHAPTAELLVGASGSDVYRLSLEDGRFMAPLQSGAAGVNRVAVSRVTALVGTGCDGGLVQVWDPREYETPAASLRVPGPGGASAASKDGSSGCDVTALAFDERSLCMAVGTSDGRALLYDLRSSKPLMTKVHQYGLPVIRAAFHRGSPGGDVVVTADARVVKLWRRSDGSQLASIESPAAIRDVCLCSDSPGVGGSDSGLLMVGGEQERVMAYYVPALGLAPAWASYLDSLTEELEEGAAPIEGGSGGAGTGVYDDYRFVTRDELAGIGLGHLVGTPLLRAYMHGYFMDARLHARVTSLLGQTGAQRKKAAGGAEEEDAWRKARVRAAVAEAQGSRIRLQDALPAVNKQLAARLMAASGSGGAALPTAAAAAAAKGRDGREAKKTKGEPAAPAAAAKPSAAAAAAAAPAPSGGLLADSRFSALFSDPDFAIDEESEVFARLHPHQAAAGTAGAAAAAKKKRRRDADSDEENA